MTVFDPTLVQVASLAATPEVGGAVDVELVVSPIAEFVDAVGQLRGSPSER